MTNVRKHAQATNLWLSVVVDPPRALVTVTDDGCGLQDRHTGHTPFMGIRMGGMGLTGMQERAHRIGARLSVGDRPQGSGTVVELTLDPEIALRAARSRQKSPVGVRTVTDSPVGDEAVTTAQFDGTGAASSSLGRLLRSLPRKGEVTRGG